MTGEPPPRRLLVIANPAAGGARSGWFTRCLQLLEHKGCAVTLRWTAHAGHAGELARSAAAEGFDAVAAAGGDGTINEVAGALIGGPLPLGVIPLGTANVLALELGLGRDPEAVAQAIAAGRRIRLHPGSIDQDKRFLLMAGAGVDAEVVAGVSLALKRRTGKLAYVLQTLHTALRYGYPRLTVTVDGVDHPAYGVVVCNGRLYGGPFVAAPAGRLDQPGFVVCLLGRPGLVGTLRAGAALLRNRLSALPEVTQLPGRHVRISGDDGGAVQADGDVVAKLPVDIRVMDEPLAVLAPPTAGSGRAAP